MQKILGVVIKHFGAMATRRPRFVDSWYKENHRETKGGSHSDENATVWLLSRDLLHSHLGKTKSTEDNTSGLIREDRFNGREH
jgi:hypothetical protein